MMQPLLGKRVRQLLFLEPDSSPTHGRDGDGLRKHATFLYKDSDGVVVLVYG